MINAFAAENKTMDRSWKIITCQRSRLRVGYMECKSNCPTTLPLHAHALTTPGSMHIQHSIPIAIGPFKRSWIIPPLSKQSSMLANRKASPGLGIILPLLIVRQGSSCREHDRSSYSYILANRYRRAALNTQSYWSNVLQAVYFPQITRLRDLRDVLACHSRASRLLYET
jgi:hypothetical protein